MMGDARIALQEIRMRHSGSWLPALLVTGMVSVAGAQDEAASSDTAPAEKPWSAVPAPAGAGRPVSTICQFLSGPKAHGWHDYAPLSPAVLGSSCQDGIGSAGVVVTMGHGQHY
jgi:hypothetical protein